MVSRTQALKSSSSLSGLEVVVVEEGEEEERGGKTRVVRMLDKGAVRQILSAKRWQRTMVLKSRAPPGPR